MDLDEARAFLRSHHRGILANRAVAGEHPDWNDYRSAMQEQQRVIIRIDMERAGPDRHA